MMPCPDGVDILAARLLTQLLCQTLSNTVDAAYSRHNPYLVTHTNIAVLAYVALEGALLVLDVVDVALGINGLVGVLQRA